jgi:hypothetical protein
VSVSVYRARLPPRSKIARPSSSAQLTARGTCHNFRLIRPSRRVWRVLDDSVKAKTPAVGGVLLSNQDFPPSVLEAPYNANPWQYALGAPLSKPSPLNKRRYTSDDPYQAPLNLRDLHCGNGKGQPSWIKPHACWEPFGRIPVVAAEYEVGTWTNQDESDIPIRSRRQLHTGKRAQDGGALPPAGTWNVSAPWTFEGLLLPAMRWSTRQTACSWCHGVIPEDRTHFCCDEHAHKGDLLRRRRKRAVKSGRWPEPRYEKRRWCATRDERADLSSLHLNVRSVYKAVMESLPDLKLETYD